MNEFTGKDKEKLKLILLRLEAYQNGCHDTFNLIEEQNDRTMKFYNEKIHALKKEIGDES
jgi:hypothetical protein